MEKRYGNVDILKAICAYLVIIIHFEFPFKFLYAEAVARVAVPMFFVISGFFCKGEGREIRRKIKHLLLLFVVSEVIYFGYYIFLYRTWWTYWIRDVINYHTIGDLLIYNYTNVFLAGWFILALAYMYVLYWLITKVGIQKIAYAIAPIVLLWLWIGQRLETTGIISDVPMQPNILRAYPFFLLGVWIREHREQILECVKPWVDIFLVLLGLVLTGCERYILNRIVYETKFYIYFGTIFMVIGAFLLAIRRKEITNMPLLQYIGRYLSTYIYILHFLVILIVNREMENKVDYLWICIFSTVVAWMAYRLVEAVRGLGRKQKLWLK